MSLEQARFNMIEQQIRPWNVLDAAVLDTMGRIPRENFVPVLRRSFAFADVAVPIGHGESMMHPRVEGRLLQELALTPNDVCLEVGTGTGYLTACLASMTSHVYSVDQHQDFINTAQDNLDALGVANATLNAGDAAQDWTAHPNSYDVIVVTGSMPEYDDTYEKKLKEGGRMFVVVGERNMHGMLITRGSGNNFSRVSLFETDVKALTGLEKQKSGFVF